MKYWNLTVAAAALMSAAIAHSDSTAHPDLTGVWMSPMTVHEVGFPLQGGVSQWKPASEGDPRKAHVPTLDDAKKRGDQMAAALAKAKGDPSVVAFGPPKEAPQFFTPGGVAAFHKFDPKVYEAQDLGCYPFNVFMRLGGGLGPLQIVQNPKAIMLATAINGDNFPRVVYMDGRNDHDAVMSWEGFSVGHWAGSTLHVETTKIKGDFFNMSWPLSDDAKLIEDFTVIGTGPSRKLEILQKVVDPANYKEPIERVSYLDWRPDLLVQDFPCEEGKADQVEVTADK